HRHRDRAEGRVVGPRAGACGGDRGAPARGDPGERARDLGVARHDALGGVAERDPLHAHREPVARRETQARTEDHTALPLMESGWDQRLGFWWIAEDHPDHPAIAASPDGACSYAELAGRAHQLVHLLRASGLQPGDAVAALLPNGIGLVECALACNEAGWYFLPLNTFLTGDEVGAILEHSGARALIVHERFASQVATVDGGALATAFALGTID